MNTTQDVLSLATIMILIDILEGKKLKIRAGISMGVNQHHSSLTAKSYDNLEQLLFGLYCFLSFFFLVLFL